MSIETIAVTGGNGWLGRSILAHLNGRGYHTVNLARGKQREEESDQYVRTDLLDPGNVYGSLAEASADALVHMGTIASPENNPGHTVYRSNVMSTYYLLEAAGAIGVDRICLGSSLNAMGSVYQEVPAEIDYLPVDEAHPRTPRDPYAMGKHALEITADGFGRKPDGPLSIASLRYPWVAGKEQLRERFVEQPRTLGAENVERPPGHRDELFSYIHIDDAVTVARRAVETELDGHEIFWTVAGDTTMATPTVDVLDDGFPDAEVRAEFEGCESLVDISKARRLLDWEPDYSWRDL